MTAAIDQSIAIAAPVERAWELVSTSAGISSWFVETTVEPGPSGSVTLRFGPGAEATVPIQLWEPPHRIRFGAAAAEGGRTHELQVTGTPGGGCVVRLVDSGLSEAELPATRDGWTGFLARLKARAEGG